MSRERGELSCELGSDRAWMFQLKRELQLTPLPNSLLDALQPLSVVGIDLEMLAFVIEEMRGEMQAKLAFLGIADVYNVDFALAVYAYVFCFCKKHTRYVCDTQYDIYFSHHPATRLRTQLCIRRSTRRCIRTSAARVQAASPFACAHASPTSSINMRRPHTQNEI